MIYNQNTYPTYNFPQRIERLVFVGLTAKLRLQEYRAIPNGPNIMRFLILYGPKDLSLYSTRVADGVWLSKLRNQSQRVLYRNNRPNS